MKPFKKQRNRFMSCATNKGLLNQPGENNCFLNSAIQVLWHLDVFRRSFRLLDGHACMGASCIFCALKNIFQQFQYSKDHALAPNALRSALAETFHEQNRFQLGSMDDAAECFENILTRIHVHIGNEVREDVCTAPHCIPHQKFGLTLVEQYVCPCGATSEPVSYIEMVHYVSATALCSEDEAMRSRYGVQVNFRMFGRLVRVAGSYGDQRTCPSNCGGGHVGEVRRVLMNRPDVVSVGIIWDSEKAQIQEITNLINTLGTTLRLSDLFHTVVDEKAYNMELVLVGMVCYYGKHYSTFFFHSKLKKWVYFDDAQVSEVGKRWANVIEKCVKSRHQPLLLLYANAEAQPISTNTAPRTVTMLPGYSNSPAGSSAQNPADVDSLTSEDYDSVCAGEDWEEGSSGTESALQASSKTSSVLPDSKRTDHHRKSKSSSHHHHHHRRPESSLGDKSSSSDDKLTQEQLPSASLAGLHIDAPKSSSSVISSTPPKKKPPAFMWNRKQDARISGYSEPVAAQWTKYTPYPIQKTATSGSDSASGGGRAKTPKPTTSSAATTNNSQVAIKNVGSNGVAAFFVTGKSSSSPAVTASSSGSNEAITINSTSSNIVSVSRKSSTSTTKSHLRPSSCSSGSDVSPASSSASAAYPPVDEEEPPSRIHHHHHTPTKQQPTDNENKSTGGGGDRRSSSSIQKGRYSLWLREAESLIEESRDADSATDHNRALECSFEAQKLLEKILDAEDVPQKVVDVSYVKYEECSNLSRIYSRRNLIKRQEEEREERSRTSSGGSSVAENQQPHRHHRSSPTVDNDDDKSKDNLIDLNKVALNHFQHKVEELYHKQALVPNYVNGSAEPVSYTRLEPSATIQSTSVLNRDVTDVNHLTNSSNNQFIYTQPPVNGKQQQKGKSSRDDDGRTNIFVYNRPKLEDDTPPTSDAEPATIDDRLELAMKKNVSLMEDKHNNKHRSKTPNPRSSQVKESLNQLSDNSKSVSSSSHHQRRSKTPTPSSQKLATSGNQAAKMRVKHETGSESGRPRSVHSKVDLQQMRSPTSGVVVDPLHMYHHMQGLTTAAGTYWPTPPHPMLYQQYYYEMMQQQQKQQSGAGENPSHPRFTPPPPRMSLPYNFYPPTTTAMLQPSSAYNESLRLALLNGANRASLLNNAKQNSNIYELNKPKPPPPLSKNSSKKSLGVERSSSNKNHSTSSNSSSSQITYTLTPATRHSTRTNNSSATTSSQHHGGGGSGDKFDPQQQNNHLPTNAAAAQDKLNREGMLKWTNEAAKRPLNEFYARFPLEYRNKLLQDIQRQQSKQYSGSVSHHNPSSVELTRYKTPETNMRKCKACQVSEVVGENLCESCKTKLARFKSSTAAVANLPKKKS